MKNKLRNKKLIGWEKLLKEMGYRYHPLMGDWVDFEHGSAFNQNLVDGHFRDLDDLRETIIRYRTDPEFREEVKEAGKFLDEETIEAIGGKLPKVH